MKQKFIYFMRPVGEVGPIKIGCSATPPKRLRSVEIWSPLLLELVAFAPSNNSRDESVLHQMFGQSRRHGEWFEYSDRLGEVVSFVERTGQLPPLDYSLCPYAQKRRDPAAKSAMPRRASQKLVTDKASLTSRIQREERRVYTFWGAAVMRPTEVQEIVDSYHGFDSSLPAPEQMAVIDEYLTMLRQLPAADRSLANWREWHRSIAKAAA